MSRLPLVERASAWEVARMRDTPRVEPRCPWCHRTVGDIWPAFRLDAIELYAGGESSLLPLFDRYNIDSKCCRSTLMGAVTRDMFDAAYATEYHSDAANQK